MNEAWKEITGYEGLYEISNLGRVRTAKDKTTYSEKHGKRTWKQRTLKQKTDKNGYKRVSLWKNKCEKTFLVHRLVAEQYIKKIPNKDIINHKDGNPSNNYVTNLEWCDYKENLNHAFENRLNKSPDPTVLVNLNTKKAFYFLSKSQASKFLGRNHGFISRCLKNNVTQVDEYEIYVKASWREDS